ncbi:hypothetical protein H0G86_003769 [Trichoderma simmonsii]|uniref:Uncharacterized protein n=1 Tax=Trichoderma simmonsii TaxID=1491479 RepID=A0A8G0LB03_9HYPO|nr:hypothetical protein H0G86_003769 [Trichoderma simmonsii]
MLVRLMSSSDPDSKCLTSYRNAGCSNQLMRQLLPAVQKCQHFGSFLSPAQGTGSHVCNNSTCRFIRRDPPLSPSNHPARGVGDGESSSLDINGRSQSRSGLQQLLTGCSVYCEHHRLSPGEWMDGLAFASNTGPPLGSN